jgi:hypothetical protein
MTSTAPYLRHRAHRLGQSSGFVFSRKCRARLPLNKHAINSCMHSRVLIPPAFCFAAPARPDPHLQRSLVPARALCASHAVCRPEDDHSQAPLARRAVPLVPCSAAAAPQGSRSARRSRVWLVQGATLQRPALLSRRVCRRRCGEFCPSGSMCSSPSSIASAKTSRATAIRCAGQSTQRGAPWVDPGGGVRWRQHRQPPQTARVVARARF